MNEPAQDQNSIFGRAAGTALGIGAAGVGVGAAAYGTAHLGGKVYQGGKEVSKKAYEFAKSDKVKNIKTNITNSIDETISYQTRKSGIKRFNKNLHKNDMKFSIQNSIDGVKNSISEAVDYHTKRSDIKKFNKNLQKKDSGKIANFLKKL